MSKTGSRELPFWWDRFDRNRMSSIFELLFPLACRVAQQSLGTSRLRYVDEEDIALSACWHLCLAVLEGRIEDLDDERQRRLLTRMVRQKAVDYLRRAQAAKRGGGNVRGDSGFEELPIGRYGGIDQVPDSGTHGMEEAMFKQNRELLLAELGSDDLRRIVLWKVDGYENAEIAQFLGVCRRTVERKLLLIRKTWSRKGIR